MEDSKGVQYSISSWIKLARKGWLLLDDVSRADSVACGMRFHHQRRLRERERFRWSSIHPSISRSLSRRWVLQLHLTRRLHDDKHGAVTGLSQQHVHLMDKSFKLMQRRGISLYLLFSDYRSTLAVSYVIPLLAAAFSK